MSSKADHDEGIEDLCPVSTIHSFPVNYFVENIVVRRSGQLLVTVHNRGELIQVDPHSKSAPCLVHKFPTGAAGIVEVEEDVFYVSVGTIGEKGSFSIYRVDMSSFALDASSEIKTPATVSDFVPVPEALFLNGSALLSASRGIILAADSILGTVFSIDVKSPAVKVWLQHKALAKVSDNPNYPGVNGIKMQNGYLYLTNTDAKTFLRAGLTGAGDATGSVDEVYDRCNADDFAFDSEGSVYLTTHVFQSVVKIRSNGARSKIAGGPEDIVVAGTTAAAFGRTPRDRTILYVTTTGGMSLPVNGEVGPARVLSLEVGHTATTDYRPGRVLFVATSHDDLGNGTKTGVWLEEAAEPYVELTTQGIEVVIASPKGGAVPIDPRSKPNTTQAALWESAVTALDHSLPLADVSSSQFDGIFLPGGHGPMFDLAKDEKLATLLQDFHTEGKPIGAVCHGPAGLTNAKTADGNYLVAGKKVTSYSWAEEVLAQLDKDVPFNLEQSLREHGGLYTAPAPRKSHVVVDGLLVTGQNPASSRDTASAFAGVLSAYRKRHHLSSATSRKYQLICHLQTGSEGDAKRAPLRSKHYDFLSANQSRIVAGGPTFDSSGKATSMMLIVEAESEKDAADFIAHEPYTNSGDVFSSIDILRWHQVIPGTLDHEMAKLGV